MKAAVIVFPGSNCDRDVAVALRHATGSEPVMHWHRDTELPPVDLIVLPGGFSYGDYLRVGAIAAQSPVMREVVARAGQGVAVLGICNGFQMLAETGLLPGALMRNADLKFVCRRVGLRVETADSPFTGGYRAGQVVHLPVAHMDGNYYADRDTLRALEEEGRVAFRYVADEDGDGGAASPAANPNGSADNIAGILNARRTVLGLMPHPERAADPALGGTDGVAFFTGLARALA
jgi:phosphoribosylformylglycinamidine synthase